MREFLRHRTEEQYGVWIADLGAHGLDDDPVEGDEVVFPEGYDRLATPVRGVLHVAGEATWSEDPATVTAALRSGHRVAENILGAPVAFSALWI